MYDLERKAKPILINNELLTKTLVLLTQATAFSALMGYLNMHLLIYIHPILFIVVGFFIIYLTSIYRESVFLTFCLTGWVGFQTGYYLLWVAQTYDGAMEAIWMALGGTAITFFITTIVAYKKDLSNNALVLRIMFSSFIVIVVLSLLNYFFFQLTQISIIVCCLIFLFSVTSLTHSLSKVFRENPDIHYTKATSLIFLSTLNIFLSLLRLILIFKSKDWLRDKHLI